MFLRSFREMKTVAYVVCLGSGEFVTADAVGAGKGSSTLLLTKRSSGRNASQRRMSTARPSKMVRGLLRNRLSMAFSCGME
jgi:hypothetical protein